MKKTILIVDESIEHGEEISDYLNNNNYFVCAEKIADDGINLEDDITKLNPDYVLIDLDAKNISNLDFLYNIENDDTMILIQSKNIKLINAIHFEYYKRISKVYVKPYDIEILSEDLVNMSSDDTYFRKRFEKAIACFNFNKGSKGYKYLIESLLLTYRNPSIITNMERDLFPVLEERFNEDSRENIKWSLQKLMVSMVRYTDKEKILEYFPFTQQPSLKIFLCTINGMVS